MKEEPFYFPNKRCQLFGILHYPHTTCQGGFVFCHPFGEEKLWAHRVFVNFARLLAQQGFAVLRFDFMGNGDSEGKFEQCTVESKISDINVAIAQLREKCPDVGDIGLLGLRYGASLAMLALAQNPQQGPLILWDPVLSGAKYMNQLLRANLTTQLATHKKVIHNRKALIDRMNNGTPVNIEGYLLSKDHYDQALEIDLTKEADKIKNRCLVVQIGKDGQAISEGLSQFSDMLSGGSLSKVVEDEFWKEIKRFYNKAPELYRCTLEWLRG
ncbi:MAG: alpha/beta hydrolase [Gammaproteobacteria bacterium]|nr:alpha/beta hydrolase [Gammaproteobacteria bacterium]MDH5799232.1 alpha/beta hydrolase [Gammaproteobacteria bacterium]